MTPLAFVAAAAAGALARYAIGHVLTERAPDVPVATLVVNVAGALALGLLVGLAERGAIRPASLTVLGTGFCGAFTTFSTFTAETVALFDAGRGDVALTNVALTITLGTLAAGAGILLGLR